MRSIDLRVDEVLLEAQGDPQALAALGAVVQRAFEALAERLRGSPVERFADAVPEALEELAVSSLSMDELLGARGAERLADELYTSLAGGAR